eukprot:maker-scaffold186_size273091-snap-gene-1.30 protein:Tk00905 transcript:maker-scaffold186_size273091-snap-gene-1.30-mRNA-1 annotation:"hypothetical protein DAPPUDRAFT_301897"
MGTFLGHLVPGICFTLFGFYHVIQILHEYFRSLLVPYNHSFESRSCWSGPGKRPIEAYVKVFAAVFGVLGEILTAFDSEWNLVRIGNGQHITMFTFFGIHGVVDMFIAHGARSIPRGLDYLSGALAFAIEAVLFIWHLHGRSPMDVQVHTLLVYLILMCVVGAIWEMNCRHDVKAALTRASFMTIQGVWFIVVGQLMYPILGQNWSDGNHEQMMIVTMIFCWTIGLTLTVEFLLACFMLKIAKRRFGGKIPESNALRNTLGAHSRNGEAPPKGYRQVNLHDPELQLFSDEEDEI